MELMLKLGGIAVVTLVVIAVIRPDLVKTLWGVLQAHLGQASRELTSSNIGKLLNEAVAKDKGIIIAAADKLHEIGGKKIEWDRRKVDSQRLVDQLTSQVRLLRSKGFADTSVELVTVATELGKAKDKLTEAVKTGAEYDKLYVKLDADTKQAQARVDAAEAKAQSLAIQLDVATAASNLPDLPGANNAVQNYTNELQSQVDTANAKANYNANPVVDTISKLEAEVKAKAILDEIQ